MQHLRMRLGQRQRLLRALAAGAGNDHLRDAGRARARQHGIEVMGETFVAQIGADVDKLHGRSEEHTSELQSLMRISYAVFCLKKKTKMIQQQNTQHTTDDTYAK